MRRLSPFVVSFLLIAATACSKRSEDKAAPPPAPTAPAPKSAPGTPATPSTAPTADNPSAGGAAVEPSSAPAAGTPAKIDIPNAIVFEGNLLGGHPEPEELQAAAKAGYKTVINLQGENEPGVAQERDQAKSLGLAYVAIPVHGPNGLTKQNAEALDQALAKAKTNGPAIVHCASGARVSGLYTLRAYYVQGKSVDDAIAEGKKAGLNRLEPLVRQLMAANPNRN